MLGVLPRVIPKVKQTIPSNFVLSFKTILKDSKKNCQSNETKIKKKTI